METYIAELMPYKQLQNKVLENKQVINNVINGTQTVGEAASVATTDGDSLRFFVGTQAEYEALADKSGVFALTTDDDLNQLSEMKENIVQLNQDVETLSQDVADLNIYSTGLAFTDNGDGTCSVSGIGTCTDTDIVIPLKYDGLTVTSVGVSAFYGNTNLASVVIPDSVTSIGDAAFSGCSSLTNITIPNSVTSIGHSVFYGCSSLKSVKIPDGVTTIANVAFDGCSSLTSVTIPDSVTSIAYGAFQNCTSLTRIYIPNGVTSVDQNAFAGCANLTIYCCGGASRLSDWNGSWNPSACPVVWGVAAFDAWEAYHATNADTATEVTKKNEYFTGSYYVSLPFGSLVIGRAVDNIGEAFDHIPMILYVTTSSGTRSTPDSQGRYLYYYSNDGTCVLSIHDEDGATLSDRSVNIRII